MLKTPGQPPITDRNVLRNGLERFHATFSEEVDYEIQEVGVGEDWAWVQIRERVVLTPKNGEPTRELSGIHLGILVRGADGDWRLHRDVSSFDGGS